MENKTNSYLFDYLGIAGSGICLIHCLFTPILIFLKPYLQDTLLNGVPDEHHYWDYAFLLISFIAVFSATQHTNSKKITKWFWVFFSLFAIAILFEDDFKYLPFLGYAASIGLIITHFVNIKHCKKCQTENFQLPS